MMTGFGVQHPPESVFIFNWIGRSQWPGLRRHEAASTLITTNRPTQDWGVFLGDVPAATAILDRFLAHATIVQMSGKSYRLRQRTGGADD